MIAEKNARSMLKNQKIRVNTRESHFSIDSQYIEQESLKFSRCDPIGG